MKEFIIAIIITLMIMVPTIYGSYHNSKTVENYCSVAHQHSVTDYKVCRELSQTELIEKLAKDFNKKTEFTELEVIK